MPGVKINLGFLHFTIFHQFILLWLFGVIFESVLCVPDVHRIVLKTHRRTRDRDHYKSHSPDHRYTHRPVVSSESHEDDWSPVTTRRPHQSFSSYRLHKENENKRGKPRNRTTPKSVNIADVVEFTTSYPEKFPIPIIESIYNNQILNNSLDLQPPSHSPQYNDIKNIKGKVRQHREKETSTFKSQSNGYEVYEEIIGDILPPPPPRLKLNVPPSVPPSVSLNVPLNVPLNLPLNIPLNVPKIVPSKIPFTSTTSTTVTIKHETNHIKANKTEVAEEKNKAYGRRTKSRRNRGTARSDQVQ